MNTGTSTNIWFVLICAGILLAVAAFIGYQIIRSSLSRKKINHLKYTEKLRQNKDVEGLRQIFVRAYQDDDTRFQEPDVGEAVINALEQLAIGENDIGKRSEIINALIFIANNSPLYQSGQALQAIQVVEKKFSNTKLRRWLFDRLSILISNSPLHIDSGQFVALVEQMRNAPEGEELQAELIQRLIQCQSSDMRDKEELDLIQEILIGFQTASIEPLLLLMNEPKKSYSACLRAVDTLGEIIKTVDTEKIETNMHDLIVENMRHHLLEDCWMEFAKILYYLGWTPTTPEEKVAYWLTMGETNKLLSIGEGAVMPLIKALRNPSASTTAYRVLQQLKHPVGVCPNCQKIYQLDQALLDIERIGETEMDDYFGKTTDRILTRYICPSCKEQTYYLVNPITGEMIESVSE